MALAAENGCKTVDFPSISTACLEEYPAIERVRMVCFNQHTQRFYQAALEARGEAL